MKSSRAKLNLIFVIFVVLCAIAAIATVYPAIGKDMARSYPGYPGYPGAFLPVVFRPLPTPTSVAPALPVNGNFEAGTAGWNLYSYLQGQ